jgi:hypothetical protein
MERMEDVERFNGIEALKERRGRKEGLLNVVVDGDKSAEWVG